MYDIKVRITVGDSYKNLNFELEDKCADALLLKGEDDREKAMIRILSKPMHYGINLYIDVCPRCGGRLYYLEGICTYCARKIKVHIVYMEKQDPRYNVMVYLNDGKYGEILPA